MSSNNKAKKMTRNESEFLLWIKNNPDAKWTYNREIAEWLAEFPQVDSLSSLFQIMYQDGHFEDRHYVQVMTTWEYYWKHISN